MPRWGYGALFNESAVFGSFFAVRKLIPFESAALTSLILGGFRCAFTVALALLYLHFATKALS